MNNEIDLSSYLQKRFNFLSHKIKQNPKKGNLRLMFNDELNAASDQGYLIRIVEGVYLVERLEFDKQ